MHALDLSKLAWPENSKEVTLRPYSFFHGKTEQLDLSLHSKASVPSLFLLCNQKMTPRGPFVLLGALSSIYLELKALGQVGNVCFFL